MASGEVPLSPPPKGKDGEPLPSPFQTKKSHHLQHRIDSSIDCVRRSFTIYEPSSLCFSFNGGKESTVILYLIQAVARERGLDLKDIRIIHFSTAEEFEEEARFCEDISKQMSFDFTVDQGSFKAGVERLVNGGGVKAFFLGSRRTDPWCSHLDHFSPSSSDWPAFMRVNPIIEWSYADVWDFLLEFDCEYCSLYKEGFTSIGDRSNTEANPYLRLEDGTYQHACKLVDEAKERCGRVEKKKRVKSLASHKPEFRPRSISKTGGSGRSQTGMVVVVSPEVLGGTQAEANLQQISSHLARNGVRVKEAVILPGSSESIKATVIRASSTHDLVVVCGGTGGEARDTTLWALAAAFASFSADVDLDKECQGEMKQLCNIIKEEGLADLVFPSDTHFVTGVSHSHALVCKNVVCVPGQPGGIVDALEMVWPFVGNPNERASGGESMLVLLPIEKAAVDKAVDAAAGGEGWRDKATVVGQMDGSRALLHMAGADRAIIQQQFIVILRNLAGTSDAK